eukprot:791264-Pleurochrysis_carterae.AAC.1
MRGAPPPPALPPGNAQAGLAHAHSMPRLQPPPYQSLSIHHAAGSSVSHSSPDPPTPDSERAKSRHIRILRAQQQDEREEGLA